MTKAFIQFRGLTLSIFLTVVLVSCGGKKANNPLLLKYNKNGLIVSAQINDPSPINKKDTPYTPGERLLSTQWGQSSPFNNALPDISSSKPPVGCVNTAMAQVMYYFRGSIQSRGVVKKEQNWADLNTQTNWDVIPSEINSSLASFQKDEISDLMRKLVIANRTKLATNEQGGSSTNTDVMIHNLIQYFGFANQVKRLEASSTEIDSEFINAIVTSIDSHQPVFLSLHGTLNHLVIIDGYKEKDGEYLFHLNMGWSGMHDGFYSLKNPITVTEEFERDGSTWQRTLEADNYVIHASMKPCDDRCFDTLEDQDVQSGPVFQGTFSTNHDVDIIGPFNPSNKVDIRFDYGRANGYYITILNDFGEPLTELVDNSTFSSDRPFYIRTSPVSFLTARQYIYDGSYKFQIKIDETPVAVTQPQVFNLELGTEEIILNNKNETILKTSILPYSPEAYQFLVLDSKGEVLEAKIQSHNNLIKIVNKNFGFDKTEKITIQAISTNDSHIIAQQELSVLRPSSQVYAGKNIELRGSFSSISDTKQFAVALEGKCHINGSRGYSNQAFYIEVADIAKTDEAISEQFEFFLYSISVSLSNNSSNYPMADGFNDFRISISCPHANYDLTRLETLL